MKRSRKTGRLWAALLSLAMVTSMLIVPASAYENSDKMEHDYLDWLDFDQEILYVDWEPYQARVGLALKLVTFYRPIVYVPLGTIVKVKGENNCITSDLETKISIIWCGEETEGDISMDDFIEKRSYLDIGVTSEGSVKYGIYSYKAPYIQGGVNTIACDYTLYIVGVDTSKPLPYDPTFDPTTYRPHFSDVSRRDYYWKAVDWAFENGFVSGTSQSTFSPNQTCSTAQILTILYRANGSPTPTASSPFSDISTKDYFYKAAVWAYEKGLVSGGQLNPNMPCTRSMIVTYLWKLAGSSSVAMNSKFTDVPANAEYAQAVAWAVNQGITSGTSATTFSPDATCTRGQIVTFLYRAMGKSNGSKQQNQTQQSNDGWVDPMQQLKELESQGYDGYTSDGTGYSDEAMRALAEALQGLQDEGYVGSDRGRNLTDEEKALLAGSLQLAP